MPKSRGKIWVLMVEDNREHAELCVEHLPSEEFQVDIANTASESLDLIDVNPYDIVLVDYSLPDMTGLDLLRAIKSKGSKIPVVFVTASNDTDISMKALKAGACDYFVKTFKYYDQLRGRIIENLDYTAERARRSDRHVR